MSSEKPQNERAMDVDWDAIVRPWWFTPRAFAGTLILLGCAMCGYFVLTNWALTQLFWTGLTSLVG